MKRLLLLLLALTLLACAPEDHEESADLSGDEDQQLESKEQALCAGPPASYVRAVAVDQGAWLGYPTPAQFNFSYIHGGTGVAWYSASIVALSRNVTGPCASTGASSWTCAGNAYACPAWSTVNVYSYWGWSDTPTPLNWTPGNKSNGCGKTWQVPTRDYATGLSYATAYAQPGNAYLLQCAYKPGLLAVKAL